MNKKLMPWYNARYFLLSVLGLYIVISFYNVDLLISILSQALTLFMTILPIFLFVFFLMILTNYFITPNFIQKHMKENKVKKWIFFIIGGLLSSGPIYMWYPILDDLRKKGLDYGLIACFLYNRSVKLPLLPLIIFYFGLKYTIILNIVMIFVSVIQGIIINKLLEVKNGIN